jgi:hypothetical protein
MIRKLNYTNRIKIFQDDVRIRVDEKGGLFFIDADLSSLSNSEKYELPPNGVVYVEAYQPSVWMRFNYGYVKRIQPPKNHALEAFDNLEGIKFRIKVTSAEGDHRLLAEADKIRLEDQDESIGDGYSLLNVVSKSGMGDEIYRVNFSNQDGSPELWINNEQNKRVVVRSAEFQTIALPPIFREILTRIIIILESTDDDDDTDWKCQWIQFAKTFSPDPEIPDPESEQEDCFAWIDGAVSVFSKKLKLRKNFKTIWSDES